MRARQSHVLWLIENAPRSKIAGTPTACLERDEDDESYEQARGLWLKHLEANPHDTAILGNAANFFILRDMALSEKLLQTARSLEPRNPQWSDRLGHLYHLRAGREDTDLRENSATALREFKAAEEVKLGVPWHADEPEAAGQDAQVAVTTLLTRMHSLPDLAKTACDAGEFEEAARYANDLLELTQSDRLPPFFRNEGNAIHDGNLVLGRCALIDGKVEEAKKYLLAAGMTPGSPQLGSFGPNMTLAKALLERGEVGTVVEYFELCRRFWKMGGTELDEWIAQAQGGEIPDFGANLRY
jgi:tetratricopeptide (TPR) repeat protein